jgi:hypothetical protein
VDSLLLYVVVTAGAALILAGAYGLAPSLLPRRRRPAELRLVSARLLGSEGPESLAAAQDAPAVALAAAGEDEAPPSLADASLEPPRPAAGFDPLLEDGGAWASDDTDAAFLDELLAEVELLRAQVRRLRAELDDLRAKARARTKPGRSNDRHSPRRLRPQARVDLPPPLRRQLSSIRSGRLRSGV